MAYESFIAANRFGFGLRPDMAPPGGADALIDLLARGAAIPDYGLPPGPTTAQQTFGFVAQRRMDKKDPAGATNGAGQQLKALNIQAYRGRFAANMTGIPLFERLTLFWSNHFTVSIKGKGFIGPLASAMERDAIRPHLTGKFEDMLLAVATNPAMLLYLDQATSVGPNSPAGQRRKAGLNENYAREVMELHTVGVKGGYTQADVTTLAGILTGWTLDRQSGRFMFNARLHEPGAKTVMGRTYGEDGQEQGIAALRDLAAHPATAQFIATKLVRHFVSDDPAEDDIARVADIFRQSGGDLGQVTSAVIGLPGVWRNPLPKVKTPYELMLSAFLATGYSAQDLPYEKVHGGLTLLGQPPFAAPSPAGWPDRADDWIAAEAIMNRVELLHGIAQKMTPPNVSIDQIAAGLIGPVASADTLLAIKRAPSPQDGFALALASPEFQRR